MNWFLSIFQINEDSPFFEMGPTEILAAKFELIVTIEGVVEPTGNTVMARTSYLPNEILWGYRYENMVSYSKKQGVYLVDCSNMNAVIKDEDTPNEARKETLDRQKEEEGESDKDDASEKS